MTLDLGTHAAIDIAALLLAFLIGRASAWSDW